jgi:peptidoglycan hydrolase-like protein with peptidoglycan-binding domain
MKKPILASALIASTILAIANINIQPASAGYSRCQQGPNRGSYCFQLGDRGPEIYRLIENLRCAGYYRVGNDSYYGPVTQRAIYNFQVDHGIYPDGIAGPQTRNLLLTKLRRY